jgi:phage terminase large subunit
MTNLSPLLSPSVRIPPLSKVLEQIRRQRLLTEAASSAHESERRLEEERQEKLDHEAERARCGLDAAGIVYWFNNYVWTYDPRLIGRRGTDGKPLSPYTPFRLWPRQEEFIHWLHERVTANEEWLTEKSRDTGVSYLCCGYALNRWLFADGFKATFGSRKAEYVDKSGQPDSLFEKLRIMARRLPEWMLPEGFQWPVHSLFMRLMNPATGAIISGEGGEDMGRGGRSTLYIVDEAAFVPNAESVEKALSGNTDCVGWVSSVNGMGNMFARKRHSILTQHQIFRLHWRDDPRKTEEWATAKEASLSDPAAWASEYEIDYAASLEGVCIPAKWVESAKRIAQIEPRVLETNMEAVVGLDVGAGKAKSVAIPRKGPVLFPPQSRGDPDTIGTAHWALEIAAQHAARMLNFDSPGVGVGVTSAMKHADLKLLVQPVNTGDSPSDRRRWEDGRTSDEMFGNLKAEIWWLARVAFQRTHQHVLWLEGKTEDEGAKEHRLSELLALPSGDVESDKLNAELSVVRYFRNEKGKLVIETKRQLAQRGIKSPDYADAFVLTFVDQRPGYSLLNA